MLNLIYGPSGSGKSAELTRMIRADVENGIRCFLLVPEQQAYVSERDLPKKLPENAGLFFEIVNFSGLCDDVFRAYGGVTRFSGDRGARALIMWDVLRSLSGVLSRYGRSPTVDMGLTADMLSAVEDLKNNGVTADQLESAADRLPANAALQTKLRDLSAVAAVFDARMEEKFGGSATDRLLSLAGTLSRKDYFAGANLYVDSFTSFTVPEYAVLTEIMRQAGSVTVALCTNALRAPMVQFAGVAETARRLVECAAKADCPVRRLECSAENNCRPRALRMLERDLWRFDLRADEREKLTAEEAEAVTVYTCSNLYAEAEAVALNILDLVRGGMRYGDVAVFMRETETYRGVLDAALERHGIPYFFSDRTDLAAMPLARLILSALRAVTRNYRAQDVITLVKTGLCGVDPQDAALFEEYCETWQINGSRFRDKVWNMNPDGLTTDRTPRADAILEAANRVRAAVIDPLEALAADLRASDRMTDRCRAVYDYLARVNVAALLSDRAAAELSLGQTREAGESVRLYEFVNASLLKLCDLMPETTLSAEEFLSVVSVLFSESDLGSVPNVHDCVIVGSAATMRVENVQAAFLLGLCEGEFPKSVTESGILTDSEKDALRELDIRFDTNRDLRSSEELLYVYRAVTKPLKKLFLSAPLFSSDGTPRTQSLAMTRVRFLLNDRVPELFRTDLVLQNNAKSTVKNDLLERSTEPMPQGTSLRLSKSRIQSYVNCPYSYYSNYTLHLREKKTSSTTVATDGTFVHFIFQRFMERMLGPDGVLRFPTEEELQTVVDETVLEFLDRVCPIPPDEMDTRMLHLFARLRDLSVILLRGTLREIENSRFRPRYFEEKIGGEHIPDLSLPLANGGTVHLSGTIDRVDLCREGEKVYVRVIDYKTGSTEFRLEDVRSGKDMQLLFYLYAATRSDPDHAVPAGAYYLKKGKNSLGALVPYRNGILLDDPVQADEFQNKRIDQKMTKMSAEELSDLIEEVKDKVVSVAEGILSGNAEKTPSEDACKYCAVRPFCNVAAPEKKR